MRDHAFMRSVTINHNMSSDGASETVYPADLTRIVSLRKVIKEFWPGQKQTYLNITSFDNMPHCSAFLAVPKCRPAQEIVFERPLGVSMREDARPAWRELGGGPV
jgi:hypothetical protein